jgi:hypothetical protein
LERLINSLLQSKRKEGWVSKVREFSLQPWNVNLALGFCLRPKLVQELRFLRNLGLGECVRLEVIYRLNLGVQIAAACVGLLSGSHAGKKDDNQKPPKPRSLHRPLQLLPFAICGFYLAAPTIPGKIESFVLNFVVSFCVK